MPHSAGPFHATIDFDQEQQDLNEFFYLDPKPIDAMSINTFSKNVKLPRRNILKIKRWI